MRRLLCVAGLCLVATAGLAVGLVAADTSTGTVTACATATAPGTTIASHTIGVDGTDVATIPAVTVPDSVASQCQTATYTIPTVTNSTTQTVTVTGPTTTTATTGTTTTAPVSTPPPSGTTITNVQPPGMLQNAGDIACAAQVFQSTWEPVPANNTPNHTLPSGPDNWSNVGVPPSFTEWYAIRAQIDGSYTGTTDEILQWAACKWGLDANLARAEAVQESDWRQLELGDVCGPAGEASYGILQVKNENCKGVGDWGGYPNTYNSTAFAADAWAASIRACINGDFDQGWLPFSPGTVQAYVAAHGLPYVIWGCVGFWFSGGWYGSSAQTYIAAVQKALANQTWLSPNGP